jgi:hypothetical protein
LPSVIGMVNDEPRKHAFTWAGCNTTTQTSDTNNKNIQRDDITMRKKLRSEKSAKMFIHSFVN